ncbi:STAS domain-containing protein [Lentibacter algarum]|uniref:STAS domain-containing protein n=1 Tax=Lentibacter algarum TaxID=576131 RepID=UPI001C0668C5|nr:STAS domain-containing protein [Lentibacter algarum]MBU2981119.1 STAS domain-containing protein [Lentibacter algarum]
MEFSCKETSDVLIVKVDAPRIDAAAAISFKQNMREITGKSGISHVVLDLSEVGFIDSSGLGAIVSVMKLMGGTKRLDLAALTPTVEKVFRLTRMDSIFTIYAQSAEVEKIYQAG